VRPTKTLGQNFVVDPNTIRKVVDVADLSGEEVVLEIGAGLGSLTLGLATAARRVVAVELDPRLIPILREVTAAETSVEIVEADALKLDHTRFPADAVVANLPYNIAASVVIDVLQRAPNVQVLTVMTQREVAERLAATPGSKIYGLSSVLVAFHASARFAGTVSRRAFYPVPNVDSAIVRLERRPAPDVDPLLFREVARASFAQRRKTMRNCIAVIAGGPESAQKILAAAEVDANIRAEELGLDAFVRVTQAFIGRA
jgi:16S rRNA (adenine1518-N6/adenine1519-N6)-dimethyltransferase